MSYKHYLALVFTFIAIACERASIQPSSTSSGEKENEITLSDAIGVASHFVTSEDVFVETRSRNLSISKAFTIKDTDNNAFLHAINYDGGGYVLISSDNRIMPIQAYSSEGEFSSDPKSYPLGLSIWMEGVLDSLKIIKSQNKEVDKATMAAWSHYLEGPINHTFTRSQTPEGGMLQEADTIVGPFLSDKWHQESPYNDNLDSCPHYYLSGEYAGIYHPVVGCAPLAIARVMRYHNYPTSFEWNNMPDDTPQTSTTKAFIKTVHDNVKSYFSSYSYNVLQNSPLYLGFGVPLNYPIGAFLRNVYGYAQAEDNSYSVSSYTAMRREMIDHNLPCIISGSTYNGFGHFWICDGYHYNLVHWLDYNNEPIGVITTYLHYCWGDQDTTLDGWYSSSNVSLGNISLQYNMHLTNHISPIVDYWADDFIPIE